GVGVEDDALAGNLPEAHAARMTAERRAPRVVPQVRGVRPLEAVHGAALDAVDGLRRSPHVTAGPERLKRIAARAEPQVALDAAGDRRCRQKRQRFRKTSTRVRTDDGDAGLIR